MSRLDRVRAAGGEVSLVVGWEDEEGDDEL